MKKTLFASFLLGTLLTSSVSCTVSWPASWSSRPNWSYTIPGIPPALLGSAITMMIVTANKIMKDLDFFCLGVALGVSGFYSLYKGLITNRVPLQKETATAPLN